MSNMTSHEADALATARAAMQGYDWRIEGVLTFGGPSSMAVQVYVKSNNRRWAKAGPLLFPPDGGDLSDVLRMLGDMAVAS